MATDNLQEISFSVPDVPTPVTPERPAGVYLPPEDQKDTASGDRMQQIIKVLEDPDEVDLAGAMRLLAVEIASSLLTPHTGGVLSNDVRNANNRIKNLRELSKQIQESSEMSTRDFLNFDGPRFQFVFKEIMILFRSSVVKAGLAPETADHILRCFREGFIAKESDLRRDTAKLDLVAMASTFSVESTAQPVQASTTTQG